MTIQISVLIWTIICFCALMLVLDRLLFRPVLGFMHERRRRIDEEKARRLAAAQQAQEEQAAQAAALAGQRQEQLRQHLDAVAQERAAAERVVAEKKLWVREQLERDRCEMEAQRTQLRGQLAEKLPELAAQLADRLTVRDNND